MVNRERFMLDVDSEGFPQRYDDVPHPPAALAGLNIGRTADHAIVQALLADHKCLQCEPPVPTTVLVTDLGVVDVSDASRNLNYADPRLSRQWVDEARALVREADQRMAVVTFGVVDPAGDLTGHGITRLSDRAAPDAYFGWKS